MVSNFSIKSARKTTVPVQKKSKKTWTAMKRLYKAAHKAAVPTQMDVHSNGVLQYVWILNVLMWVLHTLYGCTQMYVPLSFWLMLLTLQHVTTDFKIIQNVKFSVSFINYIEHSFAIKFFSEIRLMRLILWHVYVP